MIEFGLYHQCRILEHKGLLFLNGGFFIDVDLRTRKYGKKESDIDCNTSLPTFTHFYKPSR